VANTAAMQQCLDCHNQISAQLDEIRNAVTSAITSELQHVATDTQLCESCILGQIHDTLQSVIETCESCDTRIIQAVADHVSTLYQSLIDHYPNIPTPDDVAAKILSGIPMEALAREELKTGIPFISTQPSSNLVSVPVQAYNPQVQIQTVPLVAPGSMPSGECQPQCPIDVRIVPPAPCPPQCPPGAIIGPNGECWLPQGHPNIPPNAPPPPVCPPGQTAIFNPATNEWDCVSKALIPPQPPQPPIPGVIGPPPGPIPQPPQPQPQPPIQLGGGAGAGAGAPPPFEFHVQTPAVLQPFINWCDPTIALKIQKTLGSHGDIAAQIQALLGFGTDCDSGTVPAVLYPFLEAMDQWWVTAPLAKDIYKFLCPLATALSKLIASVWPDIDCLNPQAINARGVQLLLGIAGKWVSEAFNDIGTTVKYTANYYCPELIPGVGEINELQRRGYFLDQADGAISDKTWDALVRANGYCPDWQALILKMGLWQPNPREASILTGMTEICPNTSENTWRRAKVWGKDDRSLVNCLNQFNPGPAQAARWWTSLAQSDNLAQLFGLDIGWNEFWTGDNKTWAKLLAVNDETMKHIYRKSWNLPMGRQAVQMFFKIRPDSLDPEAAAVANQGLNATAVMDADGIPAALQKMEIEGRRAPLPVGTIKQLFDSGYFNGQSAISALKDHSFSDKYASLVLQSWVDANKPKGGGGGPKKNQQQANEIIKLYEKGAVGRAETMQVLINTGSSPDEANALLDNADIILQANRRLSRRTTLYKRYMYGDITDADARSALMSIGYDAITVAGIIADWQFDMQYKHKEATLSQLCKWWKSGFLTDQNYLTRLLRIGYTKIDAERIAATCGVNVSALNPLKYEVTNGQAKDQSRARVRRPNRVKRNPGRNGASPGV